MAGKRLGRMGKAGVIQPAFSYRGTELRRRLGDALLTAAVKAALPCWCEHEEVGRGDVMQNHRGRKTELVA